MGTRTHLSSPSHLLPASVTLATPTLRQILLHYCHTSHFCHAPHFCHALHFCHTSHSLFLGCLCSAELVIAPVTHTKGLGRDLREEEALSGAAPTHYRATLSTVVLGGEGRGGEGGEGMRWDGKGCANM